jgi:hypothetical protein
MKIFSSLAHFSLPEVADGTTFYFENLFRIYLFIVFDDVEYAELAFRDAQNLVMYYRQQGQLMKETKRNRKRRDNQRLKKHSLKRYL